MMVILKNREDPSKSEQIRNVADLTVYQGADGSESPALICEVIPAGDGPVRHFNLKDWWMEVIDD